MKTQSRRKKIKYSKHEKKMSKKEMFFSKGIKNFWTIINKFKRRWHPLNNAEIKMINQLFEDCNYEVNIFEKICIDNVEYIIRKSTKFKFNYILSVDHCRADIISIKYDGKNRVIVSRSYVPGHLMGSGQHTIFAKEKNRWVRVKNGTIHWMS